MTKVISMVEALRMKGAPVTAEVINSVAKGFTIANDQSLLIESGGYISLSHEWGRNVLYRMDQEDKKMLRKNTCRPWSIKRSQLHFQQQIKLMQEWHQIPDDLIINLEQTSLSDVCSPNHTLHFKGGKSVPLVGKEKSKQITGTFSCVKSRIFLPMQLIYQGKTYCCHPTGIEFPEGFNIIHTKNHLSYEGKVIKHLQSIIFPFAKSKRAELDLEEEQKCMLIFVFKAQCNQRVFDLFDENHCVAAFIKTNLTHVFQPLDLAINGVAE